MIINFKFYLYRVYNLFQIRMKRFAKIFPYIVFCIALLSIGNLNFGQISINPNKLTFFYTDNIAYSLSALPCSGDFQASPGLTIPVGGGCNASFIPSSAGIGIHVIHYIRGGSYDKTITLTVLPIITFNPTQTTFCSDGPNFSIDGYSGTPGGGTFTFSGTGVSGGTFYPSTGNGTYTITATYTLSGVSISATSTFIVQSAPNLQIVDLKPMQCQSETDYPIRGYDVNTGSFLGGGSFIGRGITDNGDGTAIFSPNSADLGFHNITFTYTDAFTCTSTVTQTARVGTEIFIEELGTNFCQNDLPDNFTYRPNSYPDPRNGIYIDNLDPSNKGTLLGENGITDLGGGIAKFDPSKVSSGIHTIYYVYYDLVSPFPDLCENITTQTVSVYSVPVVNFNGLNNNREYCFGSPDVTLTGQSSGVGVFSGDGVLDNSNGTATFRPSLLGTGTYSITYSYTSPVGGCTGSEKNPLRSCLFLLHTM